MIDLLAERAKKGKQNMLKKTVVISCVLLLSINLSIFSEESGEQQAISIHQELKAATMKRNVGIVLTGIGILTASTIPIAIGYWIDVATGDIAPGFLFLGRLITVGAIGSGVCLGIGITRWCTGARDLRNAKEKNISLLLQGPDLVRGNNFGGISISYSY